MSIMVRDSPGIGPSGIHISCFGFDTAAEGNFKSTEDKLFSSGEPMILIWVLSQATVQVDWQLVHKPIELSRVNN